MNQTLVQPGVFHIITPAAQQLAVVVASPHSGRQYPPEFLAAARVDQETLAHCEDRYVDELVGDVPRLGVPVIRALFPRSFLDLNREAFELDPEMFAEPLPPFVNARSPRVAAGLGTIARVVNGGIEIYDHPLHVAEALSRIEAYYQPYHRALAGLVAATRDRFGVCLLIDCHSMPSAAAPGFGRPPDFVLGDCHAMSCAPELVTQAESVLRRRGYRVARNRPYAGGYTTRHYGQPAKGIHALQIEINRALYMDESSLDRLDGFLPVAAAVGAVVTALGRRLESQPFQASPQPVPDPET